ncbi:MAG: sugar kinase, partial [Tissierellales bacterium]|nr:sugar kinase [Tissierellales bacterium]
MIITFGEIMLRFTPKNISERINQAIDFTVEPGGSESNVAIALSNLGLKTCFITKLPENQLSKKIIQYLNQFSINTEFIKIKGSKVGIYWTENGIGPRNSFVIYDRENSSFINIEKDDFDWENIFKNSIWFHFSGISPALSEKVFDVLINALEINKSPVSVDLNFRQKLWNWAEKDKEK